MSSTEEMCQDFSTREFCNGIQGIGKHADICCAADCTCTCGGDTEDDPACLESEIRADPPEYCTGEEPAADACALGPEDVEDSCGVAGITGIASDDGVLCCPSGCGMCGGEGCGAVPMSWVAPGDTPLSVADDIPADDTSEAYCCTDIIESTTVTCGDEGVVPPCLLPQEPSTPAPLTADTCGVDGISGIASADDLYCCPRGCGQCGGSGCGEASISAVAETVEGGVPSGAKTTMYCCSKAFDFVDAVCGVDGGSPPCHIPQEAEPTLAPQELSEDTCNVEGMSGIASSEGTHCCPLGCGQCGGVDCGTVPISYIEPTVDDEIPAEASASAYCCVEEMDETDPPICGEDGATAPCLIPAPEVEDSCYVEGIEGVSDDNKKYCCPLGCGLCGGEGCGGVPISYVLPDEDFISEDVTSSDYCCLDALVNITQDCGVEGVGIDPPCLIPNGTVFPTPEPTPTPVALSSHACEQLYASFPDADSFSGVYNMDEGKEDMYIHADMGEYSVMTFVPYEEDSVDIDSNTGAEYTTVDATDSVDNRFRALTDICGSWVIAPLDEMTDVMGYPRLSVEDCATYPEEIDAASVWVVQEDEDGEASSTVAGFVECFDFKTSGPTFAPTLVATTTVPTTSMTPAPTTSERGIVMPTSSPTAARTSVAGPIVPSVGPVMAAAPGTTRGGSSEGLSTAEATGLGVGVGVAVLVGAAGLGKWIKGRNSAA